MNTARQNLKVQKFIAAISILLFFIKIAAWYITDSVAILTDALESIVNVVAGLIGVYSLYVSAKPRDIDHPYGHGKIEFISAAIFSWSAGSLPGRPLSNIARNPWS